MERIFICLLLHTGQQLVTLGATVNIENSLSGEKIHILRKSLLYKICSDYANKIVQIKHCALSSSL